MKDSTHTRNGRSTGWLAILGSLVCLVGCVGPLANKQPIVNTLAPTRPPAADATTAVSTLTGEALTPPPAPDAVEELDFHPDQVSDGTVATVSDQGATGTAGVAQAIYQPAAGQNGSQVVQTAGGEPYVARQYPSDPASTYNLPPPSQPGTPGTFNPNGPTAPPGTIVPGTTATTTPNAPVYGSVPPPPSAPAASGPVYGPVDGAPLTGPTGLVEPYAPVVPYGYQPGPRVREADLIINGFPARTGRIMLGGAVNSDAGVTGQLTIDERNFDICRWPRSFQDLFSGTAFRGAGQTFRIEAAPGTDFKRYTMQFADPNLFGYKPVSMSISGFLYDRRFNDWDEERLGGRLAFGYRITPDLSLSAGITGQRVDITRPRVLGVPELDAVLGKTSLYSGEFALNHDTRDSPIQASRGHFFEFKFEQAFGDFDYSRFELEYRKYWLLAERADGSGKQTISYSTQAGYSGDDTPIYENFFAGGYATLRGFEFRGASPVVGGVEVGGRFQWLNSVEYMFPITADDAFRGVAFVDFGTVEPEAKLSSKTYRVAPGLGLRVAIPMLGPAPLAFDFAYPVAKADTDQERVFSFYMSLIR